MNAAALCKRYNDLSYGAQCAVSLAVYSGGEKRRADLAPGSELGERAFELVELLLHGIDARAAFAALERGDEAFLDGVRARLALLVFFRGADTRFAALVKEQLPLWQAARRLAGAPTLLAAPELRRDPDAYELAVPCGSLAELAAGLHLACAFCGGEGPLRDGRPRAFLDPSRGRPPLRATLEGVRLSFGYCHECGDRLALSTGDSGELFGVCARGFLEADPADFRAVFGEGAPSLLPASGPSVQHVFLAKSAAYLAQCERLAQEEARKAIERALVREAARADVLSAVDPERLPPCLHLRMEERGVAASVAARMARRNGGSAALSAALVAERAARHVTTASFPLRLVPGADEAGVLAHRFEGARGAVTQETAEHLKATAAVYSAAQRHCEALRSLRHKLVCSAIFCGEARASRSGGAVVDDWTKVARNTSFPADADALFGAAFEARAREVIWLFRKKSERPRKVDSSELFAGVLVLEVRRRGSGVTRTCLVCPVPKCAATAELDRVADALGSLAGLQDTLRGVTPLGQTAPDGSRRIDSHLGESIKKSMEEAERSAAAAVEELLGPANALGWHDAFGADAWLSFLGAALRNHRSAALRDLAKAAGNKRVAETPAGQLPKHALTMLRFGEPAATAISGW